MPGIEANAFIPNPAQTAQAAATNQQTMLNNFQLYANMQAGQAIQRHLNPDGSLDVAGFSQDVSNNKMLAPFLNDILTAGQKYEQSSIATTGQGQALVGEQIGRIRGALAAIDRADPDAKAKGAEAVARLAASGAVAPNVASNFMGNANMDDLIGQSTEAAGTTQEIAQNIGTPSQVSTGAGTQTVLTKTGQQGATVAQAGGPAGFIQQQLTPGEAATPVNFIDSSNGSQRSIAKGDLMDPANPGHFRKNVPGVTDENGTLLSGLAPAASADQTTMGTWAGQRIAQLNDDAANNGVRLSQMDALFNDLDQIDASGGLKGGPATDILDKAGSWLKMMGVPDAQIEEATKAGGIQAAQKLIQMVARQQATQLGIAPTDLQSQQSLLQVPTTYTTATGRQKIRSILEGNEAMRYAQIKAWQAIQAKETNVNQIPNDYQRFTGEFARRVPAWAFQYQYATPADQAAIKKSVGEKAFNAGMAQYNGLKKQGWTYGGQ